MKKLKIQMNGRSDEFQTPKIAINCLLPYLKIVNFLPYNL